jgi:putative DNA primase/helicase
MTSSADAPSSPRAPTRETPRMRLIFLRRIATIEAARATAREARAEALKCAATYRIDDAAALGDAYSDLLERCEPLFAQHGRDFIERELWHLLTAGGQNLLDPHAPPALAIVNAASVAMEPIRWLWPGRVPLGKLTLIAGEGGMGKSQVAIAIGANVTRGGRWPCGEDCASPGRVLLCTAEDDPADTIVPRLVAAGADLERVEIIRAVHDTGQRRGLNLQLDLALIEDTLNAFDDMRLAIIDPITSYLGQVDSHKNAEVRSVLEPVAELAARRRLAITGLTHFVKGTGVSAIHRVIGSVAFTAVARVAHILAPDPNSDDEDRRLFIRAKSNISRNGGAIALRLEQMPLSEGIIASYARWTGEEIKDCVANDVLRAVETDGGGDNLSRLDEAKDFLRAELARGERPVTELEEAARRAGIAAKTLRSAREALGIRYRRDGFGPGAQYFYGLP